MANNYYRRAVADDDNNPDGDFIPTTHKLEFLKYDGTGDPLPTNATSTFGGCRSTSVLCTPPSTFSTTFNRGTTAWSSTADHQIGISSSN
jgi:hypothetical protein